MKNIGMVIVVAAMIATGCRMDTRYPLIPTASAATMDTPSNTTRIDIDLSAAHTDARYTVRGTQIYYDLGLEPSKAGAISVKTNSILSAAITLAPGGAITFTGLTDIYVSNAAQPGKMATLMVSQSSTIYNNPTNPLSNNASSNPYGIDENLKSIGTYEVSGAGLPAIFITVLTGGTKGTSVRRLSFSAGFDTTLDSAVVVLENPTGTISAGIITANGVGGTTQAIDGLYLPPGWKISVARGGLFASSPNTGNGKWIITMLFKDL